MPDSQKGKVIFLNGVSSSGKTTLALALQQAFDAPYFIISQDIFRKTWGNRFWEDSPDNLYNQTMSLMYKTIRLFSENGKNVIVDHMIFDDAFLDSFSGEGTLRDAVDLLSDYPVLFVHVFCDIKELRRRERARGDREIGHAESQLAHLYPEDPYDLSIDTHALSTADAVERIIEAAGALDEARAFRILRRRLSHDGRVYPLSNR